MSLEQYQRMRDFRRTPEPRGRVAKRDLRRFVVQEHHASKLHFDFRLEMGGVLKSWSVPKGPSLDPAAKRFAVQTEDHPVEYLKFEGRIPEGEYGAGEHMCWDRGRYELLDGGDPLAQLEEGRLKFELKGEKLRGAFSLIRVGGGDRRWLLIKSKDEHAQAGWKLQLRRAAAEPGADKPRAREDRGRRRTGTAANRGVKKFSVRPAEGAEIISAGALFKRKELRGDAYVKVGAAVVALSHLEKVYWPDDGYTKGDLLRYYFEVSRHLLPYLEDRPLIMKRYPDGIRGKFFHQHDVNEAPDYVRTEALDVEEGHDVDYVIGGGLATLLYMANLGAIERHPWHSRVESLDRPDWIVFDLDPEEVTFAEVCEVAVSTRQILGRLGLDAYAKTSGSRGMHIYVPLEPAHDYRLAAEFAAGVAELVVRAHPEVATVERSLKRRARRRIYVDHMQNARGKSVVAPYSVRPRAGATVSAPLTWAEVEGKKITPQDFNIKNMPERVRRAGDLFRPVLGGRQLLTEETLGALRGALGKGRRRGAKA